VTVNTDNRLITDTTVSKELWLCHAKMGLSFSDVKSIIVAGFKSSFRPFHEKQAALRRVTQELARYDESGALKSSPPVAVESRRARGSAELPAEPHS
jgi:adenosine deaminase